MHSAYAAFALVPLTFDAKTGMWTGSATMPSPYDSSLVSSINANAEYYGGPYDVYVSGLSADGRADGLHPLRPEALLRPAIRLHLQPGRDGPAADVSAGALERHRPCRFVPTHPGRRLLRGERHRIRLRRDHRLVDGERDPEPRERADHPERSDGRQRRGDQTPSWTSSTAPCRRSCSGRLPPARSTMPRPSRASPRRCLSVTISSPAANASYAGEVNAQVALKGTGITAVTFFLDGSLAALRPGKRLRGPVPLVSAQHDLDAGRHAHPHRDGRPVRPYGHHGERVLRDSQPALCLEQRPRHG